MSFALKARTMNRNCSKLAGGEQAAAVVASSNPYFRQQVLKRLESRYWIGQEALGGAEALAKVEEGGCRALLLDRWLPDLHVSELIEIVRTHHPEVEILVLDPETGKPWEWQGESCFLRWRDLFDEGLQAIASSPPAKERTVVHPGRRPPGPQEEPLPGMLGTSEAMRRVYRLARLVAPRDTMVYLIGETGTGKELVARAIHQLGPRARNPFVVINCAAIPETLLEAELFGHVRGAFTGAFQSRLGRIQAAHGGTLLLDEVGELPLSMQVKLLRFLQEGEVQRLGSTDVFRVDVRVIAATNANLNRRVDEGRLREDLYYRLAVFPIELAPLQARREDILPLATHYLQTFCAEAGVASKRISAAAAESLERYAWPGNVRELKHMVERGFILSEAGTELLPEHFSLPVETRTAQRKLRLGA
jgi:DNA-binding NtrC family response regulator